MKAFLCIKKQSPQGYFSFKVEVKITVHMHTKYEVSISYGSKVIAKINVDNEQANKQTDRQTDRTKTICP